MARARADWANDFERAMDLQAKGDFRRALAILERLAVEQPDAPAVFGMLGHVQEELGDLDAACKSYRRTTQLNPKTELGSVSLFFALVGLGRFADAVAEADRFRLLGPSERYDEIFEEHADLIAKVRLETSPDRE